MGVLAVVLLIALVRMVAPNLFWTACAPIFTVSDAVAASAHKFFTSFENAALLAARNENLTEENAALASENLALTKRLREFAVLAESSTSGGIVAGVIVRPPQSSYDTLMLAGGSRSGIMIGMEAFAGNSTPIGVVTAVFSEFSQVTLFSAPNIVTNGWVGSGNVPLTILGAGGGVLRASVPRSADIKEGDVVFAPGPGMLPIGSVVRADSEPRSPSVTLRISPAVNLFSVGWVELRDTGITFPDIATSTTP